MDRLCSKIEFEVPEAWKGDAYAFFKLCLFGRGFLAISQNDEYGYFFQPCGLRGRDFYYQPTDAIISNPVMSAELKLHKECELLRLTLDYTGVCDILAFYAEKLAQASSALDVAIHNSKIPFILAGRNKASVNALKKIMDLVAQGNPAVYLDSVLLNDRTDKDNPFLATTLVPNPKQNYIVSDLLKDIQTLLSDFDAEIGIQSIPYQKAERMTQFESQSKGNDSQARLATWTECLDMSLDAIHTLYPDITLDYKIREEAQPNVDSETDPDRSPELESESVQ